MHYEENYMAYVEEEGCCDAVIFKLRKKRHFIVITLLLILAIVSILAGLFNGFTLKKYSDLALIIGIFFPSLILVFICAYLAFICGRESLRSSVLSRIHNLSGRRHSHLNKDVQQYSQTDSATRNNLRVRYQPKDIESIDYPLEARTEKQTCDKVGYNADKVVDYCEGKISKKHVRSFSNSDISKRMHGNHDSHLKKSEMCKFSSTAAVDIEYSPRFRRHQDISQRKKFKRSASDPANKNIYPKSREDRYVWNSQSLDKLKRDVAKVNSLNNAVEKSDFQSNEVVRKPPETFTRQKNRKSTEKCEKGMRFKEYDDCDQRYKSKQYYVNMSHEKDTRKENCYTKSEIRLYSSCVIKPSHEYKQTLRFSSFQPGRNAVKDIGEMASCSSADEKASSFSRSDCDTLEMERQTNRLENFPSERERRKTIYFPSTSNKESTRPSREYAHEYCRHTKKENKRTLQSFQRDEEKIQKHQSDKQIRFLAVNEWIQNNEANP